MQEKILNDTIIREVKKDNCFDFLRYLFATSLILAHFCVATKTPQFWFITGGMRVKAFFTITGFLVTYSFLRRNNIRSYAIKRFVRIVPAYIFCIFFCFIIGLSVSSLSAVDFISSVQTWKYLAANLFMLNWLEPELPNTFQSNPLPQMNGSLWSMKQEVIFYILVPILMWMMRAKGRHNMISGILVVCCIILYNYVNIQTQYFIFFISGMIMLLHFDKFCRWKKILLPLAIICLVPVYSIKIDGLSDVCHAIEPICFPMVLVGAAYNFRPLNFFRKYENVTYGLYLYHLPVIQVFVLYGISDYNLTLCFFLSLIATTLLACFSWFVIEKPLMSRAR